MVQTAEERLFTELKASENIRDTAPIFILAAPRTGSTTIYKAMAHFFGLPFISNFTNEHFASTPIVGMAIQKSMVEDISWTTSYGKTQGTFQPSEASAVMGNWFGGGHPSQVVSATLKAGMDAHFITSMKAVEQLYGAPLVLKNPWNCFRVKSLATALPKARFIWLQRDLVETASSDLYARYMTQKHVNDWNSATPENYQELQKRSPVEQVVENQFEFNKAIQDNLEQYAKGRWINIWLEDFLSKREETLQSISSSFDLDFSTDHSKVSINATEKEALSDDEQKEIAHYVASEDHHSRLCNMIYTDKNV